MFSGHWWALPLKGPVHSQYLKLHLIIFFAILKKKTDCYLTSLSDCCLHRPIYVLLHWLKSACPDLGFVWSQFCPTIFYLKSLSICYQILLRRCGPCIPCTKSIPLERHLKENIKSFGSIPGLAFNQIATHWMYSLSWSQFVTKDTKLTWIEYNISIILPSNAYIMLP